MLLRKLIPRVLALYNCDQGVLLLCPIVIGKFQDLCRERGLATAIKFIKRTRLHVTRYLSGKPLFEPEGVRVNKDGLPKWLAPHLEQLDLTDPSVLRGLLTILSFTRAYNTPAVLDTDTIERE